ncbi:MAG: hypothetical protein L6R40_004094 [Gallowayella cf. fulva]|nr:MAG: hypothetical protein L6R40_004094 [Xanthomendoza cf. fulva]
MTTPESSTEAHVNLLEALAHVYVACTEHGIQCPPAIIDLIQEHLETLYFLSANRKTEDVQVVADDLEDLSDLWYVLGCQHIEKHAEEACQFRMLHKMVDQRVEDLKALNAEDKVPKYRNRNDDSDSEEEELLMESLKRHAAIMEREKEEKKS